MTETTSADATLPGGHQEVHRTAAGGVALGAMAWQAPRS
jgi:hypothetical protein